jgi:hypothetical protein
MWIGRWPVEERVVLLNDIPHNIINHSAGLLREALKNIYHPIIAHVYHAQALRIHLLRGRIPMQIKSAYTTPWYDDMLPLPVHPLLCHRNLIDRDWDTSSQESAESINAPPSPTQTLRRRRHKRNRPIVHTTPHPAPRTPRTKSVPDHESYPSQPKVPLHRTRETN